MHFKKWAATGHLLGPRQLALTLGLLDVANVNVLTVSAVATTGFSSDFSGSAWTENQNCLASASQCGQLKAS